MTNKDKLNYVKEQISSGNYSLLPENIASGEVYKIPFKGNLAEQGYEASFLYIKRGSEIIEHSHQNDVELYTLISGQLSIKGIKSNKNYCLIGQSHSIDRALEDTVILALKVSKTYLEQLGIFDDQNNNTNTLLKIYKNIKK